MENTAFIALGSNMGNRYDYLVKVIQYIKRDSRIKLVDLSSVYETDPVGYEDQDLFLNMVIKVETDYSPDQLLEICLNTEIKLGRKREIRWGPRTIDLDVLLYNQENIETETLIIPHPRITERAFVMIPLLEIQPDISIPNKERPLKTYLIDLPDKKGVRLWKQINGEDVSEPIGN